MDLSIVVGNPKPASRTLKIAEALAARVMSTYGAKLRLTLDLAEYASQLFEWPNDELAEFNQAVATSDLVIFATPTYKASYTGLLKAFLDRYPNDGLAGTVAIPLMTAGSPEHAMAVEFTLRPLLVELGASVPTRGMFFLMSQMTDLEGVVDDWAATNLSTMGIIGPMRRTEEATSS